MLLVAGAAIGYRTYRLNQPIHPVLLQYPLPVDMSLEKRSATAQVLKQKLCDAALLIQVSKEVGLAKKLDFATDEGAAIELAKRVFVEVGEADLPQGRVPAIGIGLNCKVKEYNTMVEVSNRLNRAAKTP